MMKSVQTDVFGMCKLMKISSLYPVIEHVTPVLRMNQISGGNR